jgi:hypothetical protein
MLLLGILVVLLAIALGTGGAFYYEQHKQLRKLQEGFKKYEGIADVDEHREKLEARLKHLRAILPRFESVAEMEEHKSRLQDHLTELEHANTDWQKRLKDYEATLTALRGQMESVEETLDLQSYGFYHTRYGFEDSARYASEIDRIRKLQKQMLKSGTATHFDANMTLDGSATKGLKMMKQQAKLMLRAFNGECDSTITSVRFNNVEKMETRIRKSFEAINKLGKSKHTRLADEYMKLKHEELFLVHEHRKQLEAEREEQRALREQMREEERAQQEFERAQVEAEREEEMKALALEKARLELSHAHGVETAGLQSEVERLEADLRDVLERKRAIALAQVTRAGHVYILSNIGSFGEGVYKIGMTRRQDPEDRVYELGDASVPFHFDIHALIKCEDAPALENLLHRHFDSRRVNMVNLRKEYFRVSLDEIRAAVEQYHRTEFSLTLVAEAQEYHDTLAKLRELAAVSPPDLMGDQQAASSNSPVLAR